MSRPARFTVPPPLPVVTVGVTGHRALDRAEADRVGATVKGILTHIDGLLSAATAVPVERRLLTALAAGADQAAAEAGCALGWALHAVLPFERSTYRAGLAAGIDDASDAQSRFDALLAATARRYELADARAGIAPDEAARYSEARRYSTAGRLILTQADLLIAIWRGGPPRGPGGTADIVAEALANRLTVLRIDPATGRVAILTPAIGGAALLWHVRQTPTMTIDDPACAAAIGAILTPCLAPPDRAQGPATLAHFIGGGKGQATGYAREGAEPAGPLPFSLFTRFTWAMLAGSGLYGAPAWRPRSDALSREWPGDDPARPAPARMADAALGPLSIGADAIATERGHAYRSAYVMTFAGATLAVLVGLLGLLDEHAKIYFVMAEIAILLLTIGVYLFARGRRYHQRWINARRVAETLRGERALAWLGFGGRRIAHEGEGWVSWLSSAALAVPGVPDAVVTTDGLADLAGDMSDRLIRPQIAYHHRNAGVFRTLHHRLDRIGWVCVLAALAAAISYIVAGWLHVHHEIFGKAVAIVCAGLPLIAAAAAGIRFQGDFERSAERSAETAHALAALDLQVGRFIDNARSAAANGRILLFEELADIAHQLATILRSDSDDWRFVYGARPMPGVG